MRRVPTENRAPGRGVPAGCGVPACWPAAAAVRVQPGCRVLDGRCDVHREADRLPGKADERRVPRLNPGSLNSVADHDVPPHSRPPARNQPPSGPLREWRPPLRVADAAPPEVVYAPFQLITESSAGLGPPPQIAGPQAITPGQGAKRMAPTPCSALLQRSQWNRFTTQLALSTAR